MSTPYSYDLRKKAIAAVKGGKRKMDVSQMFNISRNTLDLWLNREAATGDCRAITHFQTGCRHKITDWERFRKFAQHHGDKTQAQMAQLWDVILSITSRGANRLGIKRHNKKRLYGILFC